MSYAISNQTMALPRTSKSCWRIGIGMIKLSYATSAMASMGVLIDPTTLKIASCSVYISLSSLTLMLWAYFQQ
ncbi:hypothetical protein BC629DRAFT_1499869 [Irpex lacteus]|nr:hypothetical protein BC629DRAFT_1499869 [Irpex lacteus]